MQRPVVDAVTQKVNHTALARLGADPGEKFLPRDVLSIAIGAHAELGVSLRLRLAKELEELDVVDAIRPVVISRIASDPSTATRHTGSAGIRRFHGRGLPFGEQALLPRHMAHDKPLKAFFGGIGRHGIFVSKSDSDLFPWQPGLFQQGLGGDFNLSVRKPAFALAPRVGCLDKVLE